LHPLDSPPERKTKRRAEEGDGHYMKGGAKGFAALVKWGSNLAVKEGENAL
jgi:hypothetical protein